MMFIIIHESNHLNLMKFLCATKVPGRSNIAGIERYREKMFQIKIVWSEMERVMVKFNFEDCFKVI